ncbi:Uncharacterized protein APZ42_002556, partial [Daphnia magna]
QSLCVVVVVGPPFFSSFFSITLKRTHLSTNELRLNCVYACGGSKRSAYGMSVEPVTGQSKNPNNKNKNELN